MSNSVRKQENIHTCFSPQGIGVIDVYSVVLLSCQEVTNHLSKPEMQGHKTIRCQHSHGKSCTTREIVSPLMHVNQLKFTLLIFHQSKFSRILVQLDKMLLQLLIV